MEMNRLCDSLRAKGYHVFCAQSGQQAADYITAQIHQKTVGFGDSQTLASLDLPRRLAVDNIVYDPQQCITNFEFLSVAKQAMDTQIFLTSVNSITMDGELVNLDGTGNRVAGSLFGHQRVYFVVGRNKIVPTLSDAIQRTRNVAAPANARRLKLDTPCAKGEAKCYDCHSPHRICNAMVIHLNKMDDMEMEVVLILEGMFSELERIMDKKKHSELLDMRQTLLEDESLDITVQAGIYSFGADATGGDESLEQLAVDGRKYGHTWHNGTLEEFEQTPAWDE